MRCPTCGENTLEPTRARPFDVRVDRCRICAGVWFDGTELERAIEVASKDLRVPGGATVTMRHCPACREPLLAFDYPQTEVRIDMCDHCHGLWLDRAELEAIIRRRTALHFAGELEEHAPVPGVKGALIRFIDAALVTLWRSWSQ